MSLVRSNFRNAVHMLLYDFHTNATVLKQSDDRMRMKLRSQGKQGTQGTGNQVTDQETAFAVQAETRGFQFIPKEKKNDHVQYITKNALPDGHYYIYQVNGSQQSIDFGLLHVLNKTITDAIYFDLKHTLQQVFCLNDGWFEKDIIYVISWTHGGIDKTFIGLGQNIPTREESERMEALIQFKKQENSKNKKVGSLHITLRFANKYSCEGWNDMVVNQNFGYVTSFLLQ